jgi:predicted helicase
LNSPAYRNKYRLLLHEEYPRIPLTNSIDKFTALSKLGKTLTELNLLEIAPIVLKISYPISQTGEVDNNKILKIAYKNNKLYINNKQYFEGIPEEVIKFNIGEHQVIKKWFEARKGYTLDYTDFEYLKRMFNIISLTLSLQREIDRTIGDFPLI